MSNDLIDNTTIWIKNLNKNMKKKEPMEINEKNKTGSICTESGRYCCSMHLSTTKVIHAGEEFPQCDQRGSLHITTWNKMIS